MGVSTQIIVSQIIVMFLIMALGFVLYRVKFIDKRGAAQMSDLVLYVSNPILIARALMRDFDAELLASAGWVALLSAVTLLAAMALGLVAYRDGSPHMRLGRFSVPFSNAGFIGIPLAQALAGADGVFFISVSNTVQTALMWTYGVYQISGDKKEIAPKKVLTNPAIIAMAAGLVCFATSLRPPAVVNQALDVLGSLNTGLVMMVLGAYLGQCRVAEIIKDMQIYKVSVLRLVVMPAATLALLCALNSVVALADSVQLTVLLYQSMPVAAVAALFAHRFGEDGDYATGVVAMSTLFSLATLPIILLIAGQVL